jgi:hypothetical protein
MWKIKKALKECQHSTLQLKKKHQENHIYINLLSYCTLLGKTPLSRLLKTQYPDCQIIGERGMVSLRYLEGFKSPK